jgi:hypothetical protein
VCAVKHMFVLSGMVVDGAKSPDIRELKLADLLYEYDEISFHEAKRMRDSKVYCGSYSSCGSSSSDEYDDLWNSPLEFDAVQHVETGVDVTDEFKRMRHYENRDGAIADAEAKILDSIDGAGRVAERRRLADLATLRERARGERARVEAEERRVFEYEAKAKEMRRESAKIIEALERERELTLRETPEETAARHARE